ncbi:MAG: thrombospondin type-1 domain-containing protein [Candidatus Moranbacteria bacterium]|nr:thrombospondin type-1 domain-containing protein [Candidatus Moranbacteria bacterium]
MLFVVTLFLGTSGKSFAAEEKEVDAVVTSDVNVYDVMAERKQPGTYAVSFDIVNNGDTQNNVVTKLDLIKVDGTARVTIDSWVEKEPFQVVKGAKMPKTVEYVAPVFVSGEYELLVSLANISGMTYSIGNAGKIQLNGTGSHALFQSNKCYLSVAGEAGDKKYPLSLGVDIDKSETIVGHCLLTNLSKESLNATYRFDTTWRSAVGQTVSVPDVRNEAVMLAAGEAKEVVFNIPTSSVPQSYNAAISLVNDKGETVSNEVIAHYVVRGLSGTLQQAQYSFDGAGPAASASFEWTPSADSHFQTRVQQQQNNTYFAKLSAENRSSGAVCVVSDPTKLDETNIKRETVTVRLPKGCDNPVLRLSLTDATGNVLDEQVLNKATSAEAAAQAASKTSVADGSSRSVFFLALEVFGGLTALVLIAILVWKYRKKSLMFILFASALLYGGKSALAMTWTHMYYFTDSWYVTLTMTGSLDKATYAPGEKMTLNYTMVDSRCNDGVFHPAMVKFRVFKDDIYDSTDTNADGSADLGNGMQGAPLSMSTTVPLNQAPGNYKARVCAKITDVKDDEYSCVNMPFTVAPLNVNGGWSPWSTTCSATCGGGVLTRTCINPAPSGTGIPCVGESTQVCNTDPCPELEVCEKIGTEWFHRANGANLNTARGNTVSLKAFYDTSIGDCAGTEVTNDQNVSWTELSDPSSAFTVAKGSVATANLTGVNVGDGSMRVSANGQSVNLGLVGFCEATVACSDKASQTCKDQDFTVTDPVCGTTFHCKGTRVCDMNIREVTPGF